MKAPSDAGLDTDGGASGDADVDAPPSADGAGLPPDPVTVAPPLDRGAPTLLFDASSFLYTGDAPIQRGVDPAAIDARRVAVLRGRVTGPDGSPATGATVTVLGHPEFGHTLTRADGAYDLVANGGGDLVVAIRKDGFLEAQRSVSVPWQDYVAVPEIVLLQPDPAATTIDLGGPGIQVARGSTVSDASGTRRATLLFAPGTQATVAMDSGTASLPTLTVHLTEFTIGSSGPQAMPGSLPPTSAYTYALEVTVDEAGGRTVELSQPAFLYVENFLGFAPGTGMPIGTYDREQSKWVGHPNGVVLKLLATTDGIADLDSDGDGAADGPAALAALGITDDERRTLATLYAAGQVLWRSPVPHFSALDCNEPWNLPADARFPGLRAPRGPGSDAVDDGCNSHGSIIQCHNQTLGEDVAVNGTPYVLHYQSDRQAGRLSDYGVDIALSDERIPASVTAITLDVHVAGRAFHQSFPAASNQHTVFTWDGKDAYNRMTQGRQSATIGVGYVYQASYADPLTLGNQFAQFPGVGITRETSPVPLREQVTITLGRVTSYRIERAATGDEVWTNTLADGTQTRIQRKADGSATTALPDGTTTAMQLGPDPRFGMQSPLPASLTIRTPGGLVQTQTTSRMATPLGADPLVLGTATETFTLNGKAFTRFYDGRARTVTVTSPLGRQTKATLDDHGRIVNVTNPQVMALQVLYDGSGRPTSLAQGGRQHALTYAADGQVATSSDALSRTVTYDRDPLGRITQQRGPDDSVLGYGFDAASNLLRVQPPGETDHQVTRDILGLVRSYSAPDVGANTSRTSYEYDADHQLTSITAPDGAVLSLNHDAAGRPSRITTPDGTTDATYDTAGRLSTLDAPGGVGLALGYDGSLQAAVDAAISGGVPYGELLTIGGWELKFAEARAAGQLPALVHALAQ